MKANRRSKNYSGMKAVAVSAILLSMICMVIYGTGVLQAGTSVSDGLSGLVSVKGTVSLEALDLSQGEVRKINRAVAEHEAMFTQVDIFLDAKDKDINDSTVLVMAMVLATDGECEIRSWSRKVTRSDLVPQMIRYMSKAASEYEKFKRYPDVTQKFKCLYI